MSAINYKNTPIKNTLHANILILSPIFMYCVDKDACDKCARVPLCETICSGKKLLKKQNKVKDLCL